MVERKNANNIYPQVRLKDVLMLRETQIEARRLRTKTERRTLS
jgi:ribosomal protein S28E/S33